MVLQSKYSEEFYGEDDEDTSTPVERRTYFDRFQGRRLIFQSPLSLPLTLYYNKSVYGFPLPELAYYFLGNGKPQLYPASHWAYNNPHPDQISKEPTGSQPSVEACRPTPLEVSGEIMTEAVNPQLSSTSKEQDLGGVLSANLLSLTNSPQPTTSVTIDTAIASRTLEDPLTESADSRDPSLTLGVEEDAKGFSDNAEETSNKMDVDGPTLTQVTTEIFQMFG